MEEKKHIISSKDKREVKNQIWKMLSEGVSKNAIYVELAKEYQSDYELASLIATTPAYEELPELQKKNQMLYILLCIVCVLRILTAISFLLWFVLDEEIENKGIASFFMIPMICLIPLIPMWLAREVKRMDGGIYMVVSVLCIFGIGQLFKEYPETGFGWIWALIQLALILSIGILSFKIYKKHFSNKMSFDKDEKGNYVFNQ